MVEPSVGEAREGIQIGRVVTCVEGLPRARFREEGSHGRPFVRGHRRMDLEHLAAPPRDESVFPGSLRQLLELGVRGGFVRRFPEVVRERQPLVLYLEPDRVFERGYPVRELFRFGGELEPVVPDVANALDAHEAPGLVARPSAHAGDEQVAAGQPLELVPGRLWHGRELGSGDDRRERAVDVEDQRALRGRISKRAEEILRHRRENTVVKYAVIGVAAGFFSALFGVGGGIIVVPLLVLLAAFTAVEASATSLAAIVITALFGAASFGALGEVSWPDAVVIGLPAIAGVLAGTALQQRVSSRLLVGLLGVMLIAIAIRLLLE